MSQKQEQTERDSVPTFGVTATAETATKTTVEARDFEFVIDEPEDLGGENDGPNPVEYLAGSLAGCLNVVCHLVADEYGIEIEDLEFEIEGELDPAKLLEDAEGVRAGYQELRVEITATTDADEATLEEWLTTVEDRCPVTDNVANETPVAIELTTQ